MTKSADAFRTISEVADWLGVQTHVLRFWESKFTQVKPVKRAGGRRYYRPADMLLLGGIRKLLHEDGLTIKGVQKILREEGMAHVADMSPPLDDESEAQLDRDLVSRIDETNATVAPVHPSPTQATPKPIEVLGETPAVPSADVRQERAPVNLTDDQTAQPPKTEPTQADLPSFLTSPMAPASQDETPADNTPPPPAAPVELASPEPDEIETIAARAPEPVPDPTPDAPQSEPDPAEAVEANHPAEPAEIMSEDAQDPVLPSFLRPEEPQVSTPAPDAVKEDAPTLPSFLQDAPPAEEPTAPTDTPLAQDPASELPSFMSKEPAPEEPRARVVDVPDDPDPAHLDVVPSALTRVSRLTRLRADQRDAIRPLLAQLTALRDQMTSARRDPR
ncbi:MerR family transcriptional regulator [uncultured Tateyamaria sp.]|uniref:MerR family transcriptional regulator n=1 Tax=uncultured Tateyamaria sp. TaxID=455651 RepID=UPI002622C4BD|nr:MerR family transcriptional regulator [uncultured Tateyamaria sp.]